VAVLIIPEVSHPEMNRSLAHLVFELYDRSYVKQPAGGVVHINMRHKPCSFVLCVKRNNC
jgi:hypothetical protein